LKLFLRLQVRSLMSTPSTSSENRPITRMAKRDYLCPASAYDRSSPASSRRLIQSHRVSYFLQKLGHKSSVTITIHISSHFPTRRSPTVAEIVLNYKKAIERNRAERYTVKSRLRVILGQRNLSDIQHIQLSWDHLRSHCRKTKP
jgi:hypothetical protein